MPVAEDERSNPPSLDIPEAVCQKCGETWNPITKQPKVCPCCNNPKWWIGDSSPYPQTDEPPVFDIVTVLCHKCNELWRPTTESPETCPHCKNPDWWKGPKEFTWSAK